MRASPPPPVTLESFAPGIKAAVVGASGGIGRALVAALAGCGRVGRILALSRRKEPAGDKVLTHPIDVEDEGSIARAAAFAKERCGGLDLVIVASGLLHAPDLRPERALRQTTPEAYARLFAVNATGPALVAKHFVGLLPNDRKAAFAAVSARVGSIGDNRLGGWHAYRASKAALNMLLRCIAIETAR